MSRVAATASWALPGAAVALVLAVALDALGITWAWWSAAALGGAAGVLVRTAVDEVRAQRWPAPWSRRRRPRRRSLPGGREDAPAARRWAVERARADLDAARTSAPARQVLRARLAEAAGAPPPTGVDDGGASSPEDLLAAAEDALGLRPEGRGDDLGRWRT